MSVAVPQPLWPAGAPGRDTAEPRFEPTLTPYLVAADRPRGTVVVCPGGGYGGRAPHEGEPIALMLNKFGISAAVCDYRVAPYRHPHPLLDAQRAIRTVRHHAKDWHVDPTRVAILGFSAGGHLASTAATHWDLGDPHATDPIDRLAGRPDAAILCYPVISFAEFGHTGSMHNLLGPNPDPALRENLSNEKQVNAKTPPTFLWHTADDGGVPVENSLLFASALRRAGVPFELHVYQHGAHGLGLAPGDPHVATWARLCGEWLMGLGF